MSRSVKTSKTKGRDNKVQTGFSLAVSTVTLLLVLSYFVQSFLEVHQREIVVIAIDRITANREDPRIND